MERTALKTSKKSWLRHVRLAIRRRWVQLVIVLFLWLLVLLLTPVLLGPKTLPSGDTSQFKFMHCDVCKMELPYNPDLANKRCPRCIPPRTGYYVPTEKSFKSALNLSPWRWVYAGMCVESLIMLAGVVYLLYLPVTDPLTTFYVLACPYCNQKLRYRAVSLGGLGSCSRCKRMVRFPDEDAAVLEVDALKAEEHAARVDEEHETAG